MHKITSVSELSLINRNDKIDPYEAVNLNKKMRVGKAIEPYEISEQSKWLNHKFENRYKSNKINGSLPPQMFPYSRFPIF